MIENRHQEASPAGRIAARRRAALGVVASYTHQSSDRHRNPAGSPAHPRRGVAGGR